MIYNARITYYYIARLFYNILHKDNIIFTFKRLEYFFLFFFSFFFIYLWKLTMHVNDYISLWTKFDKQIDTQLVSWSSLLDKNHIDNIFIKNKIHQYDNSSKLDQFLNKVFT